MADAQTSGGDIKVGALFVEVEARRTQLERGLREVARTSAAAGKKAAKDFADSMEREFRVAQGDITEALERGLITSREAERRGREAGRQYKDALLREIKQRAGAGTLSDRDFVDLTDRMRRVGETAGDEMNQGILSRMGQLPSALQALIGGVIFGFIVDGLRRISTAIAELGRAGGQADSLRRSFSNLNTGRGLDPGETMEALREGTNRAVAGMELMRRANMLLNSELPLTSANIGELAFLSRRLAESQGKDAAEGFDRVSRAITKLEPELLDELGITARVETATRAWANANDRSVESLTDAERQLAFYTAVVEEARRKVEALGEEQITSAVRVEQAAAFWADLKTAIAEAVVESPRVEAFFNAIGIGASDAAGRVEDLANRLGALIDSSAGSLLGTLIGGATGAVAGALGGIGLGPFGVVGGAVLGGTTGALAGSTLGQVADVGGPTYEEALARREAEQEREKARQATIAEIEAEKDVNSLLQRQRDIRAEIARYLKSGSRDEAAMQRFQDLRGEERAVKSRIDELRAPPKERPLTAAEKNRIEAAKKAARQVQEEMATALAGLTATAADEAMLALERLEREAVEKFEAIGEKLPAAIAAGFAQRRDALQGAADLESFARELEALADAAADPRTNAELDRYIGRLQEFIGAHDDANGILAEGTALRDRYNDLLEKAGQQLEKNRKAIREEVDEQIKAEKKLRDDRRRSEEERLRNLRDQARTLEENARGALQLAEAFGMIGSEAAQSLQAVAQLAAAVTRLAGGDLSALPSALGAVAVIGKQVFGESPEEKARQDVIERNTEALKRLEASLSGFEMTGRALTTAAERLDVMLGGPNGTQRDAINLLLGGAARGQDWAKEELKLFEALGREFGIQLFDDEGKPIVQAWEQLQRAVELATEGLTKFSDSLADTRTLQDARRNIFDEEATPESVIRDEFGLLNDFAPGLLESLGLSGVDLSVPEEVEAAIRTIFEGIEAGTIPAEILDRLPDGVRTLLEMILNVEGALDELGESTREVTQTIGYNVPLLDHALNRMRREAVFNAGGTSLSIPRPTDLGGQLPPETVDALRATRVNPWEPSHIQALLERSDPAPIVEELVRVRAAFERRPREGDLHLSLSIPADAVPRGGWNERELGAQVGRVVLDILRDDKTAQRYVQRAVRRPS